jgi:peptidyl-prolyl cis-trans isomerase SurA
MRVAGSILLLLVCLVTASGRCLADSLDRIVAVVNGDIILYSEVQERVRMVQKANPETRSDDPARKATLERDVLQQMVREKLTDQEVKRMKITVTKREVEETITNLREENRISEAQMAEKLKESGQSMEEFRKMITKDLERDRLIERVLKSKILITDKEIDAFMGQPQREVKVAPGAKEEYRLGIIFLPVSHGTDGKQVEKQAREIQDKLKDSKDFAKMARQYSKGPAAEDGGDVGFVSLDELAPFIAKNVKDLKKNQPSDVVKGEDGYYIFLVSDVRTGKQEPSGATTNVREKARRQLYQQEMSRRFDEWIKDLESRSFVKISL